MFWIRLFLAALVALAVFLSMYDAKFLFIQAHLKVVFEHDFLAHTFLFFVLTLTARLAWDRPAAVAAALLAFAVGLEIAQVWSPSREPSLSDLSGNMIGVFLGFVVFTTARRARSLLARPRA